MSMERPRSETFLDSLLLFLTWRSAHSDENSNTHALLLPFARVRHGPVAPGMTSVLLHHWKLGDGFPVADAQNVTLPPSHAV